MYLRQVSGRGHRTQEPYGSAFKSNLSLLSCFWCFFGNISRDAAETLLKQRATCEGTFLVREGEAVSFELFISRCCLKTVTRMTFSYL